MLRLHKYGNVPGAASFSFSTLDSAKQFPGPQTLRPFLRVPTKPGGDQKDGVYFFDGVWLRLPRLRTVKGAEGARGTTPADCIAWDGNRPLDAPAMDRIPDVVGLMARNRVNERVGPARQPDSFEMLLQPAQRLEPIAKSGRALERQGL